MVFFQPWKIVFPLGSFYKLAGDLNLPASLRSMLKRHWLTLVSRGQPSQVITCMPSLQRRTCCLGWEHSVTPQVLREVLGIARMFQQACFIASCFIGKWSIYNCQLSKSHSDHQRKMKVKGKTDLTFVVQNPVVECRISR